MPEIKKGIATWAGIISSVILLVPPAATQIIDTIENTSNTWSSGDKTALISGGVILIVTVLGRFAQAVAHILQGNKEV